MARTDAQLKFRIPPDLKPKLEVAARLNKRSVNMEVVARLEMSFKVGGRLTGIASGFASQTPEGSTPSIEARLAEIEQQMVHLDMRVANIEEIV